MRTHATVRMPKNTRFFFCAVGENGIVGKWHTHSALPYCELWTDLYLRSTGVVVGWCVFVMCCREIFASEVETYNPVRRRFFGCGLSV